jgi:hypothetical protein
MKSIRERLLARRSVDPITGCWRFVGAHKGNGYAVIGRGARGAGHEYVHRAAYLLWVGPIPEGKNIDHVKARGCAYRDCFNPWHLEAVTQQENTMRSDQPNVIRHRLGLCGPYCRISGRYRGARLTA